MDNRDFDPDHDRENDKDKLDSPHSVQPHAKC